MSGLERPSRYAANLVVRRVIHASPERLFDAWTDPAQLVRWWGPDGVDCPSAQIDLRVGGIYRIANRLPDGSTIWIAGVFEEVERPRRLVYSWHVEGKPGGAERVTVEFNAVEAGTEVVVTHERVLDADTRRSHENGWQGCLDSLERYVAAA
ncbi:MAG TPA: SRPBCC domain-containing protein [Steroidobacteraceae bacterium]|nr:SRPBCC domain-containing protein [Steroidobacteraceae bacterium]